MAAVAVTATAFCASFARLSVGSCGSCPSPSLSSPSHNNISRIVAVAPLRSSGFLSTSLLTPAGRSACAPVRRRVLVRAMASKAVPPKVKESSAKKRDRVAEQRRIYNKSRKTEIKTRMKKVFVALDALRKKGAESPEEIKPVESLISQAYKIIDKSVKVGTLHKNTGGNRKSRLARAKKALEIQFGWYTPASAS